MLALFLPRFSLYIFVLASFQLYAQTIPDDTQKKQIQEEISTPQPNIVFLISEDNSKHFMDLFDPQGVETPHIRKLADQGLTYTHAFSNSPVCSVARSTLITGTLATRTGMHLHRKIAIAPMPEGLEMFPAYLREAGYYTTNNVKKDYNAVEGEGVWDESSNKASWKDRKVENQPFFHQESFTESHESRLHFDRGLMENYQPKDHPDQVVVPPYYPETPTFRFTVAYHRDKIREVDDWVGRTLESLEEDGLLEDTFVFYFGDHGGVLPGSKGYLYETGLHVPLVVRVPENYKHLVGMEKGQENEGFVSFVDFGPTALKLAGIPVPEQMDGQPFLGSEVDQEEVIERDETIGYADRFDEKYEMVRSLRKGKYKYIRSFQPFYPDALHNNYRYKMLAFEEWRNMFNEDQLDSLQERFFVGKPAEMLFDLENDPHETINLAKDAFYLATLETMRDRLHQLLLENNDLGFLPESVLVDEAMDNPVEYGKNFKPQLAKLIHISELAFQPFDKAKDELLALLNDGNSLEKYWAIMVASGFGKEAAGLTSAISPMTGDNDNMVKLRAIEFLGIVEQKNPIPSLTTLINTTQHPVEALIALNSLVYFKDHTGYGTEFSPNEIQPIAINEEVQRRLDYLNDNW